MMDTIQPIHQVSRSTKTLLKRGPVQRGVEFVNQLMTNIRRIGYDEADALVPHRIIGAVIALGLLHVKSP